MSALLPGAKMPGLPQISLQPLSSYNAFPSLNLPSSSFSSLYPPYPLLLPTTACSRFRCCTLEVTRQTRMTSVAAAAIMLELWLYADDVISQLMWFDFPNYANTASKFRSVFSEFPFFNYVQSKALDDVLYTGKNFVACAPTGSGKTVLFELAIIRLLMETSEPWRDVKAVYSQCV
uniref:Helicase for meiosis 1 n=1 Tax=Lates calcarifer TaxID=8187 RepID=A0A4W6FDK6_LATCA